MASWTNLTDAILGIGKPLTYVIARAWRDNAIAIAEGAVGAPRVVVPTALSTAETDPFKVLSPNGSGGLVFNSVSPLIQVINSTGIYTIRLPNGAWVNINAKASGGGSSNVYHGGSGASAICRVSHPNGGKIEVTVGAVGTYGAGGGNAAADTTVIVFNSSNTEVARLTVGGGTGGGSGSSASVSVSGTLTYIDEPSTTNGSSGTGIPNATPRATYALTGQVVYGIGGRSSDSPGEGTTGRVLAFD